MMTIALGGCVFGLANLVFGLWALRLLYRYRKELRLAIEQPTGREA